MEKKHEFFLARSRSRSRSESPVRSASPADGLPRRRHRRRLHHHPDTTVPRPGSLALAPLVEGPDPGAGDRKKGGWRKWVRGRFTRALAVSSSRSSDLRLLLGVMGAPLSPIDVSSADPVLHLSIKDTPMETSSAQYILQQYMAACGGLKLQTSVRNTYAIGKLQMVASEFETATRVVRNRNGTKAAESGSFMLWQMAPEMWYVELAVGGSKVHAGCNGKFVWRHTPWLGAHAAKGTVRPLRRALQGLNPFTTASVFVNARCIGEKRINEEDCFILKVCADPLTLKDRSEGPAEIIWHVLLGYFSQKTGLLVLLEDSHLIRIQSNTGSDCEYWETTISSYIEDYRPVDGMMIAHSGCSVVTLLSFGEATMSHTKTRMEEMWIIEEVAFNVTGLSDDCFIPPADIKFTVVGEISELPHGGRGKSTIGGSHPAKVAALEKVQSDIDDSITWRMRSIKV